MNSFRCVFGSLQYTTFGLPFTIGGLWYSFIWCLDEQSFIRFLMNTKSSILISEMDS